MGLQALAAAILEDLKRGTVAPVASEVLAENVTPRPVPVPAPVGASDGDMEEPARAPAADPRRAPEYRRQLLWWPVDLWERWHADAVAFVAEGMDTPAAGHLAFERLKATAPRPARGFLPPTVPAPGCHCPLCGPGPQGCPGRRSPRRCSPFARERRNELRQLGSPTNC
jgi:hypothetical protein